MAGAVAAAGVAGDEEGGLPGSIGYQWGSSGGGLGLPACGDELGAPYIGESRRFTGELIPTAAEPTLARYKWTPRASPSTQATLCYPHGAPLPRIRPGEASFLISGNSCRRHRPGQSGTSSTSPSPFASPGTSSSSRETVPLLNLVREPSPPQNHFATKASSAAKLAAGSSLRPHLPDDHRDDRPGVADPSPPLGPREEPPVAGDDRRSSASARDRGRRGRKTSQT